MQNDVLKNKIAPWQEKGRWYHGTYDYNRNFIANKTDKFLLDNFNVGYDTSNVTIDILFQTAASFTIKPRIIADIKVVRSTGTFAASGVAYISDYYYIGGRRGKFLSKQMTSGETEFWAFII